MAELPTQLISYRPEGISLEELMRNLRRGNPPLIARVQQERLFLDIRTILPGQEKEVVTTMMNAINTGEQNKNKE